MEAKSGSPPKVFISHSKRNRRRAEQLASLLLLNGIPVWYDDWEILVGHNIYDRVYAGILSSDYLAIMITQASLQSRWVTEELSLARQRELENNQIVILPLLYEKVQLPLHLQTKRYADFTRFEKGFRELMSLLRGDVTGTLVEEGVLHAVREAITKKGKAEMLVQTRMITSFASRRVTSNTAFSVEDAEAVMREQAATSESNTARVFLELQSAKVSIPILVDLKKSTKFALAAITRALRIPESLETSRVAYFLLYEGYPLELDESLENAGVGEGSALQLGAYTYAIE